MRPSVILLQVCVLLSAISWSALYVDSTVLLRPELTSALMHSANRKITKSAVVGINWKNVLLLAGLKAGLVAGGLIKKKAVKKFKNTAAAGVYGVGGSLAGLGGGLAGLGSSGYDNNNLMGGVGNSFGAGNRFGLGGTYGNWYGNGYPRNLFDKFGMSNESPSLPYVRKCNQRYNQLTTTPSPCALRQMNFAPEAPSYLPNSVYTSSWPNIVVSNNRPSSSPVPTSYIPPSSSYSSIYMQNPSRPPVLSSSSLSTSNGGSSALFYLPAPSLDPSSHAPSNSVSSFPPSPASKVNGNRLRWSDSNSISSTNEAPIDLNVSTNNRPNVANNQILVTPSNSFSSSSISSSSSLPSPTSSASASSSSSSSLSSAQAQMPELMDVLQQLRDSNRQAAASQTLQQIKEEFKS